MQIYFICSSIRALTKTANCQAFLLMQQAMKQRWESESTDTKISSFQFPESELSYK